MAGDLPAVLLAQRHERARLGGGALGRLPDGDQEEEQPRRPGAVGAHRLEQAVVLVAVGLDVGGGIEHRVREAAALDEEQRDEQAAEPAVALEERVDGLEALVQERALHERREAGALSDEPVPLGERRVHLGHRRGHVDRRLDGRPRRSDPVLAAAELARRPGGVAHAAQQALVQLEHEPAAERHLRQALDAVLQRRHVVAHLTEVLAQLEVGRRRDLVEEQVDQRGRRALDARRQDGLLAQERRDEDLRVAPSAGEAAELAERRVRRRQALGELRRERQLRGQRRRHERRVAALGDHQVAAGPRAECRRVHRRPPKV